MKKRTAKNIFLTIAALAVAPAFFLLNIARYLAPDAVFFYSAVILLFGIIFWTLENKYSDVMNDSSRNIPLVAVHALAYLLLCYAYGVDSWAGKGVFPVISIFFAWLLVKILFITDKYSEKAHLTVNVIGIIVSVVAVWELFPFPLNFVPIPVVILAIPVRMLVKKIFPKQKIVTIVFSYAFMTVSLIILLNFLTIRHGNTANYLVVLIFVLEILFKFRVYRTFKRFFLPVALFLDLAVVVNICAPSYGKYFTTLTGIVAACFIAGVATLKGLGVDIAPRKIAIANYIVLFAGVVAVGAIVFSRITPCEYASIENDFKIISRSEGAYDMVLSPDGRYLYAVFGDPIHTLEKFDLSGLDDTLVYQFEEESAEPERLVLDAKRNRVVVSVWGEPNMKVAVFDADKLNLIDVLGGESLPHNPDNIKADASLSYYYVLGERIGEVSKVNADTLETEKTGRSHLGIAYGMCLDEKRELLYTSSWIGPFITVFNINTMTPKFRFRSEIVNAEINCDSETGKVYAGNFINDYISVYDMKESEKRIKKIPATFGARDLVLDEERKMMVSGTYFTGVIEGIDIESGKRLFKYKPGKYVRGIEYDKSTGSLFVACRCGIYELKKSLKSE